MIYNLIYSTDSPALRRLYAALGLLWLPIALAISVLGGTFAHLIGMITANCQTSFWVLRELVDDIVDLFRDEVPAAWRDIIFTLRTGELGDIAYA